KIQGFIFNTYIIVESGEMVYFVDQHAAHERVLYERFSARKTEADGKKRDVQELLVPEIIELTTADFSFVSDNCERFAEYGFDIEVLGDRQIALRSVPVATKAEDRLKSMSKPSFFFTKILEDLKKDVPTKGHIWDTLIQTTACKAAIKAHDKITEEEARELLRQLGECKDPYHCAHGRPTFIKFDQTDLEKDFKRIV
ncbi:MAG: DNA mismatch repair protein MutL, partial [Clostridiales bacterium]|nr:DNA mismatch repair protein MutL [Clostridiales bacterium]